MATSDGVTLRHPRLDTDTISILSSQSDSIQHLSYAESDDEGKGFVGNHSSHVQDTITQSYQPSALKKDWIMYLTKTTNGNHPSSGETDDSDNDSSSSLSDNDDDGEQGFGDDPWTINSVQRDYYTKQFRNLQEDLTKTINGQRAKEFFERSTLPTTELSQIWNLSDVNHDGALTLTEFCTAMHLVVLRLNGVNLPSELPPQLQPYMPLIDLSDASAPVENWADFKSTNDSPKQFTHTQPIADNHRIVAPVAVRLSPPPPAQLPAKPPPPPPRLPPRTAGLHETPQRPANNGLPPSSSTNTTPYLYNRTRPSLAATSQPLTDSTVLLEQIHDLLQPDHLQELATLIAEPGDRALDDIKNRNSVLKAQLKHWEDRLTDLIDKRISLELQLKPQQ